MRMLKLTTVIGIMIAVLAASVGPASAGNASTGVKYVNFEPAEDECAEWQDDCLPNAGTGQSNVLYIEQTEGADDVWTFDTMVGTGHTDEHLWMSLLFGGKCTALYRLHEAWIGLGTIDLAWSSPQGETQNPVGWSHSIGVNQSNRTLNTVVQNVHVPFADVFDDTPWGGYPLFGFESPEEIYAHGEAVVASRIADGMTEGQARSQPFQLFTQLSMHGSVTCDYHLESTKSTSGYLSSHLVPVTLQFQPISDLDAQQLDSEPIDPIDLDLEVEVSVNQAFLSVQVDESHPCRLRLAGVIGTNGPTEVEYRFVTELGLTSQVFSTTVDQTNVAMLDHHVLIPVADQPMAPQDQLMLDEGDGGEIDELAAAPSDKHSGTYHIEVLSPNHFVGNVDGYNVDYCQTVAEGQTGRGPSDVQAVEATAQLLDTEAATRGN